MCRTFMLAMLGFVSLPVLASAREETPVTSVALAQGKKVQRAIDGKLAALKAPPSVSKLTAHIQTEARRSLARAESKGDGIELTSDSAGIEVRSHDGRTSYKAMKIDVLAGMAALQSDHARVGVDGDSLYTERSHAVAPKLSSQYFIRQRWLTPLAGKPGSFHVKSHGVFSGIEGRSTDREYDITVK